MYSSFSVPGVPEDQTWQLFNVSNYGYYKLKVRDLKVGTCPFCDIDPSVNNVLYENDSWRVWRNEVAPRSGQEHQFIIPLKRHVERFADLMYDEPSDLLDAVRWIEMEFRIVGGVLVIRTGDPARNAKSVPHLHVNYQVPTGIDRVEVTIAKSQADLLKKLPILHLFERMRLLEEAGNTEPWLTLSEAELELVKDKLTAPALK